MRNRMNNDSKVQELSKVWLSKHRRTNKIEKEKGEEGDREIK